jgi:RYK receptor-like tyrosine kinase
MTLKLADQALARDLFPNDYHCLSNGKSRPLFWLSLETLTQNMYNSRTDVWSTGVAIWELFSYASQPYDDIDPFKFVDFLRENETNRLKRPPRCPQQVYDLYKQCWHPAPTSRPSLKEIFSGLINYSVSLENYL